VFCVVAVQALVFSQYTNTLDWLKQRLPEEGFGYRTITGSMPLKQRSKAIEVGVFTLC
jgi:SNF2 family DNA or RNA helicase